MPPGREIAIKPNREDADMLTVYGLKSCDTTKKALKWLERRETPHRFLDVRADGVDSDKLTEWAMEVGWEVLLNRGSTTWRNLDEVIRENVTEDIGLQLMAENPTLIKRPVIETDAGVLVGWKPEQQRTLEDLI
jgi:Spx/MgsR family transcriptional regulator